MQPLNEWLGSWSGIWRTYLRPGELFDESAITIEVSRHDGWLITYRGAIQDDAVTGSIEIRTLDGSPVIDWRDSWHTEGKTARLSGDPSSYRYGPEDDPWTWSITMTEDADRLLIVHYNAAPGGTPEVAVEMIVGRADRLFERET